MITTCVSAVLEVILVQDISVHHIIPLAEGGELLDEDNLITLCRYHHEQAEKGKISRRELQVLAKLQNKK